MVAEGSLIGEVSFFVKKAEGQCSLCPDEGEMLQITATISYLNPLTKEVLEEDYQVNYCSYCFREAMGLILNPEELQGYA